MEIKKYIEDRCDSLKDIAAAAAKELETAPEGLLSAYSFRGKYQYWVRKGGKAEYLPKAKKDLISALAQKDYNMALEKHISKELAQWAGIRGLLDSEPWEKALADLAPGKRAFAKPAAVSDDEYLNIWLEQRFEPLGIERSTATFFSEKGERMRSKSEVIISDALREYHLPYLYEKPLRLDNGPAIYPDFTILKIRERQEVIWEHFGMMDKPEYLASALKKLSNYNTHGYFEGINLITTFETREAPLDIRIVRSKIEAYLRD